MNTRQYFAIYEPQKQEVRCQSGTAVRVCRAGSFRRMPAAHGFPRLLHQPHQTARAHHHRRHRHIILRHFFRGKAPLYRGTDVGASISLRSIHRHHRAMRARHTHTHTLLSATDADARMRCLTCGGNQYMNPNQVVSNWLCPFMFPIARDQAVLSFMSSVVTQTSCNKGR